jgi:putative sporulation protein YyaC
MNLRPNFFEKKGGESRVLFDEEYASTKISKQIVSYLPTHSNQNIAIICIGTDRSTGDALGPLIGSKLEEKSNLPFHIFGTLEDPIHAVNLEVKLQSIQDNLHNPFIIGIDACLGRLKSVGMVSVAKGPVKPGAGVQKELPPVGNMHITGIVNVSGFMEFFVLQNTRLHLVMQMAETISNGIYEAGLQFKRNEISTKFNLEQFKST